MATRFEVHRCLAREEKGLFVVVGEILEGMVQVGMKAAVEGDDSESFQDSVHSLEFIEGEGGRTEPALTFHYRDPAKLQRWMGMPWKGHVLRLEY